MKPRGEISREDATIIIGLLAQLAAYFETDDISDLKRLADRFAADVIVGEPGIHSLERSAAQNVQLRDAATAMNQRLRQAIGEYDREVDG